MNERFKKKHLDGKARQRNKPTHGRFSGQSEGRYGYKVYCNRPGFTTRAIRGDNPSDARYQAREIVGDSIWIQTGDISQALGMTKDGFLFWVEGRAIHKPGPRKVAAYLKSNKARIEDFVGKSVEPEAVRPAPVAEPQPVATVEPKPAPKSVKPRKPAPQPQPTSNRIRASKPAPQPVARYAETHDVDADPVFRAFKPLSVAALAPAPQPVPVVADKPAPVAAPAPAPAPVATATPDLNAVLALFSQQNAILAKLLG